MGETDNRGFFFLIAMEEVSWFQRVLSVETPDALDSNAQGELNFHNFATGLSENGYYFGAFLALMIVPLALQAFRLELPGPLAPFAPTPVVALASAQAFAFNFDMWDIFLSQIAFYGAVAVLMLWVIHEVDPGDRWLVAGRGPQTWRQHRRARSAAGRASFPGGDGPRAGFPLLLSQGPQYFYAEPVAGVPIVDVSFLEQRGERLGGAGRRHRLGRSREPRSLHAPEVEREQSFFQAGDDDDRELEPLGVVNGHQGHGVRLGIQVVNVGYQRDLL